MLKGIPLRILLVIIVLVIVVGGIYTHKEDANLKSINEAFYGFDYRVEKDSATVEVDAAVVKFYRVPADFYRSIILVKRLDEPVVLKDIVVYSDDEKKFYGFKKDDLMINFPGTSFSKDTDGIIFISAESVILIE